MFYEMYIYVTIIQACRMSYILINKIIPKETDNNMHPGCQIMNKYIIQTDSLCTTRLLIDKQFIPILTENVMHQQVDGR